MSGVARPLLKSALLQEAQRVACAEVGVEYRDVPPDGQWYAA